MYEKFTLSEERVEGSLPARTIKDKPTSTSRFFVGGNTWVTHKSFLQIIFIYKVMIKLLDSRMDFNVVNINTKKFIIKKTN